MRRLSIVLLLLLAMVTAAACGPRIRSVLGVDPIVVLPGQPFDRAELPTEVTVAYSNGKGGTAKVTWNLAELPTEMTEDIELTGKVQGTDLPAKVTLVFDPHFVPDIKDILPPALTAKQLADPKLPELMERLVLAGRPSSERILSWSPDGKTLAFVSIMRLCVWPVGSPEHSELESIGELGAGELNHPSWSYDSKYLSVQVNMSEEGQLLVIEMPNPKLVHDRTITGRAYWAPDSHQLLLASDSGIKSTAMLNYMNTTALALLDVDTGKQRVIIQPDSESIYTAAGWKSTNEVRYNRLRQNRDEQGLLLTIK